MSVRRFNMFERKRQYCGLWCCSKTTSYPHESLAEYICCLDWSHFSHVTFCQKWLVLSLLR